MDLKRVEEIINSKGVINVFYKNDPVWIEGIIQEEASAHVKNLDNNQTLNVPISDLIEKSE